MVFPSVLVIVKVGVAVACTVVVSWLWKEPIAAVLVRIVPFVTPLLMVTTTERVIVCPEPIAPMTKVTTLPLRMPPEAETNVMLPGSVSVSCTFVATVLEVLRAVMT